MLLEILKEVNNRNAYSKSQLARKVNISEGVIEHLLMQLKEKGYIKEENINNNECSSCPSYNKGCSKALSEKPINVLTITEKGKKLINR